MQFALIWWLTETTGFAAVLDTYFTALSVEAVERDAGWARIQALPRLWS